MGFSHVIFDNPLAFNEIQPTAVLADTYVLSHLQHPSHWKHSLTEFVALTVWMVWIEV